MTETHRHAYAAMVFAVLGWTVLPLAGAILAMLYARSAERDIVEAPDLYAGSELAAAATSVAWVWPVAFGLTLLTVAIAVVIAHSGR